MTSKRLDEFWLDLKIYGSEFFEDLARLQRDAERERARKQRNWAKAQRLLTRIRVVQSFDVWKATAHIEADFFGDNKRRYERVKQLHAKKNRIEWILMALYKYWAFDYVVPGSSPNRGLRYSTYNAMYLGLREKHKESVKQSIWDAKRAKVRKRRAKSVMSRAKRDAMRDMGIKPNEPKKR